MLRAAVDLETTGLTKGRDEIIEIAIVPFDNNYKPISKFVTFVKPLRGLNPAAMAKNGITEAMVANAPTPLQVRSAFLDWKENIIGDGQITLLGQNVSGFDRPFLDYFFTPEKANELFYYKADDTMVLARGMQAAGLLPDLKSTSLVPMCTYFGIEIGQAHRAYDDAIAALKVWQELLKILSKCKM